MKKLARLVLLLCLGGGGNASTGTAQQAGTGTPRVTLPNTHERLLHSKINGRTYRIQVALPSGYGSAKSGDLTRYPTLYLLDGTWDFPLLFAQTQFNDMVQRTTKLILVGVATDSQARTHEFDYTLPLTAADSQYFRNKNWRIPPVGGAPQFLRVLKEEVIPLIDSSYRTSGDRGIEGSSFGGLFVAYAMLEEPELFRRYAMISPSLWYPWGRDKGIIPAREPYFAKQHPTFPKTIYLSVGSEELPEMIAAGWEFVAQLCASIAKGYYKGLDLGAETLAGQPHGSPAARVRVLAALYSADSTGIKPGRRAMQDCR
jgi:predicted alpha/beta superfamily hydrolase